MDSLYRATLVYPGEPPRARGYIAVLPEGMDRPPLTLRAPGEVAGTTEVFELIDDEDWGEHRLAAFVIVEIRNDE